MPVSRRDLAIAALVLLALLAAAETGPVRAGFDALALGLARLAVPLLDVLALPVLRTGAELRATDGAWAVVVTEVCDGHGLVAAWAAVTAALARTGARALRLLAVGLVAIQAFNLARVVALAATLAHAEPAFEAVHLLAFPLLTVALFWVLAGSALRRLLVALGALALLGALWMLIAAPLSGAVLVPAANGVLGALGPEAIEGLAPRPGGWQVATLRLAALDPPAFLTAPIHPEDFAIALPALLAALIAARGGTGLLALGLALMVAGLTLGTLTTGYGLAPALQPERWVAIARDGGVDVLAYAGPGDTALGLLRLAQNGVVHLNLLVLPVVMLMRRAS